MSDRMRPDAPRPEPELPRAVALAWGVATHPQRGPKRELSIERIVDAAIEIADAEGLAAVSMSRVAASLGFTTMSLYRYVTSKDDLILLMQERASDVVVPDSTAEQGWSWREGVTAWVLAIRGRYREHPWLVDIPVSGAPITPNSLTIVDWFLHEVRSLPLSDGEKMSALLLFTSYARATSAQDRDIAAAAAAADPGDVTGENFFATLAEHVTPERFPDLAPLFAAGGYIGNPADAAADVEDDFSFGLDRILDGIEYHVGRLETGAPPTHTERLPAALEPPRDKAVREAAKARREAEKALREAQKREREAIKHALEREKHEREKLERGR